MRLLSQRLGQAAFLTIAAASGLLLTGCCSTFCEKDINLQFDVPQNDNHCDPKYVFRDSTVDPELEENDGGSGVVDRDGRSGVVDRDGNAVTKFCLNECVGNSYNYGEFPVIRYKESNDLGYLVAELPCY